ncbi:MAG: NADH:ubiquinone oxidoreductase subunit NDUFA12 [Parvularculaceae bacterium]|nr:NADH:ubiquinone oxidoreductase subunit NDUFA12 [Parvularculaceae bacterium]
MVMFAQMFTWWNSTTFGTSFTLWRRRARLIGSDEQGNRYFEERQPSASDGRLRRWVVYHGVAEASRVPPDWHGWLHHTFDEPPTSSPLKRRAFEKDHLPNMTGTPLAYKPPGSLARPDSGKGVPADYEAWSPEKA